MKRLNILILLIAGLLPLAAHAGIVLQFDPANAVLVGQPGQTVGWDLIFQNDTADYAIWAGTSLDPDPGPGVGIFTDFSQFNFLIVGPGQTSIHQVFDPAIPAGAGSFLISPSAPYGVYTGQMVFVYDLYDANPTNPDVTANFLSEQSTSQAFELDVVPEPATFWLIPSFALLAWRRRR